MPFSASHAIVALPFLRTPLVPGAIAIGAMTPDLPLFLRTPALSYASTHAPMNVVTTTLLALILFLLWRLVLRPAVTEFAPRAVARRLPADWRDVGMPALRGALLGARDYPFLLALSAMLGVLSHILWDAFTHEGRWGTDLVPALAAHWGPLTGFKWLQHGSSVLGLVGLLVWMLLWLRRQPAREVAPRLLSAWWGYALLAALPVIMIAALVVVYGARGPLTAEFTVQHLAYAALPPACALWGILAFGASIIVLVASGIHAKRHQAG